MPLFISNQQDKVDYSVLWERTLTELALLTLKLEGYPETAEISLAFVDDAAIQELNKTYRKIDAATDVLSFALLECTPEEPEYPDETGELLLGDVVISLETALRQAQMHNNTLIAEISSLFVHGLLHLLGYDHESPAQEQQMRQKEQALIQTGVAT